MNIKKISQIVERRVGSIRGQDIYGNFTKKRRVFFLFAQGITIAYLVSLFGLFIYHPHLITALNLKNIQALTAGGLQNTPLLALPEGESWIDFIEAVLKYLIAFPYIALFIGLFLEKKLEE